jgi:hypothetical protein
MNSLDVNEIERVSNIELMKARLLSRVEAPGI